MIPILSPTASGVVEQAARGRALLAFDFDGTLAPIVEDHRRAAMRPATRMLLGMAGILYPVAIVSGRNRADVAARIGDAPVIAVVGNHGAEADDSPSDAAAHAQVRAWGLALRSEFGGARGVEVEEKELSIAVHCRGSAATPELRERVLERARALGGTRVFGGHAVVNVAPAALGTKGRAVEALASRMGAPRVVFVGDDVTDEDAFRSLAVTVGIRVGRNEDSAARYFLPSQLDVDDLLRSLIAARSRITGVGACWIEESRDPENGERR